MAAERDLEILDEYLANKLSTAERAAFEERLRADPGLKQELDLQHAIVGGIRDMRISELKSALSNIAVPGAGTDAFFTAKTITWIIAAAITGGALLYFLGNRELPQETTVTQPEEKLAPAEKTPVLTPAEEPGPITEKEGTPPAVERRNAASDQKTSTPKRKTARQAKSTEPVIDVFDPTSELADSSGEVPIENRAVASGRVSTTSSVTVETESDNRKYNFHYQFSGGKLILYGSFEKDLYEILEFFSENGRTIFLYYKGDFYHLNETNTKPTPLAAVTDPQLLKKLAESRDSSK